MDGPLVGLYPPQDYAWQPVDAVWWSYIVYPAPPLPGYSRVREENARYFAELERRAQFIRTISRGFGAFMPPA